MDRNGVPYSFTAGRRRPALRRGPGRGARLLPSQGVAGRPWPLPAACRARPVEYPDAPVAGEGVTSVHGTTAEGTAPPVLSLVYTGPGGDRDFALSAVFCGDVRAAEAHRARLERATGAPGPAMQPLWPQKAAPPTASCATATPPRRRGKRGRSVAPRRPGRTPPPRAVPHGQPGRDPGGARPRARRLPAHCGLPLSAGGRRAPPHATPLPLGGAAVTLPGLLGPARLPPWTAFRAPQTPRCRS